MKTPRDRLREYMSLGGRVLCPYCDWNIRGEYSCPESPYYKCRLFGERPNYELNRSSAEDPCLLNDWILCRLNPNRENV